jgi:hypothetical protein
VAIVGCPFSLGLADQEPPRILHSVCRSCISARQSGPARVAALMMGLTTLAVAWIFKTASVPRRVCRNQL